MFLTQENLQGLLYACAPRAFEQDGIPFPCDCAKEGTGWSGIGKKVRGFTWQASCYGCVDHITSCAAYPDKHGYPAFCDAVAHVAMQSLGPSAEFEHLPQNGDATARGSIPQHLEHGASRIRVGVVAVVENRNSLVNEAFPTHFTWGECTHFGLKPGRWNIKQPRHR